MRNFIVGDIIKGKKDNGYGFIDERMTKARVVSINGSKMQIQVLEHDNKGFIGDIVSVDNTYTKFELVSAWEITKKNLLDMPIGTKITTDGKEYNVYVKVEEDYFRNENADLIDNHDITEYLEITDEDFGTRIIKIEEPTYSTIYDYSTEAREMTVAEIEKALGHAVKIIKEED